MRGSANREEQQGNETLNDGRDTTVRTQPQEEFEETARQGEHLKRVTVSLKQYFESFCS